MTVLLRYINWDERVLTFADLLPDWDLENWQI